MKKILLLLVLATVATAADEAAVVRAHVAAFNLHNPAAVAATLAPGVKWLALEGDQFTVEGEGRAAVETWLAGYFKSLPDVHSEIFDLTQTGPFIAYRERASWTGKDGKPRALQALAIHEVRDGLIARVWYYPAVKEAAPVTK